MVILYTFQNIGQENLDWFRAEGESGGKEISNSFKVGRI